MASMALLVNGNRLDIVVLLWLIFLCTDLRILRVTVGDAGVWWLCGKSAEKSGPGPVWRGNLGVAGRAELWKWKSPNRGWLGAGFVGIGF